MSSANRPPAGPPKPPPRGRRPPTIDLSATEIASEPVPAAGASGEDAATQAAPPLPPEPPPAERPAEPQSAPREETHTSPPRAERAQETPPRRPPLGWLPPDWPWPLIAAGATGAVLMLLLIVIAGLLPGRDSAGALDARLARVEQQLRVVADRPASPAVEANSIDELTARLAKLESTLTTARAPATDPALLNRIAALEGEARALAERLGVLSRRNDEIAVDARNARDRADAASAETKKAVQTAQAAPPAIDRKEIEALAARIATIERAEKNLEADFAKRASALTNDRAGRLAAAAAALKGALERGDPFPAEFAAAKALAPDPNLLSPLEPFAASGVPSAQALSRELLALIPALQKAAGMMPRDGGFLEKLQSNAEKLVRIRPMEEVPGNDPAAVISRIEAKAAQSDLPGALAELAKLPPAVRASAQAWIAKAETREKALEASRRLAADALTALGK
jgi:hypothetical protein